MPEQSELPQQKSKALEVFIDKTGSVDIISRKEQDAYMKKHPQVKKICIINDLPKMKDHCSRNVPLLLPV